ncbi:MAG: transcriptional regulator [bacterium]|nr:transcriptional regulator [bacterium]MCY3953249.1 transcriptional regulator [bacterium]
MRATDALDAPTGASIRSYQGVEAPTRTISEAVEGTGYLRSQTGLLRDYSLDLHRSTEQLHSDALDAYLRTLANQRVREELSVLLGELRDLGFSWRDIARTSRVSVPALRKWRQGAPATGENRRRVATMVAFCGIARDQYLIREVASWLETPIHPDAPITPLDMIANDQWDLALRLASTHGQDPEVVLDEFEPDWRNRYRSSVEVFTGPDGLPGVRLVESES